MIYHQKLTFIQCNHRNQEIHRAVRKINLILALGVKMLNIELIVPNKLNKGFDDIV